MSFNKLKHGELFRIVPNTWSIFDLCVLVLSLCRSPKNVSTKFHEINSTKLGMNYKKIAQTLSSSWKLKNRLLNNSRANEESKVDIIQYL